MGVLMRHTIILLSLIAASLAAAGIATADHHLPEPTLGKPDYSPGGGPGKYAFVRTPFLGVTWQGMGLTVGSGFVALHVEPVIPASGDDERVGATGPGIDANGRGFGAGFEDPLLGITRGGGASAEAGDGHASFEDPLVGTGGHDVATKGQRAETPTLLP